MFLDALKKLFYYSNFTEEKTKPRLSFLQRAGGRGGEGKTEK